MRLKHVLCYRTLNLYTLGKREVLIVSNFYTLGTCQKLDELIEY